MHSNLLDLTGISSKIEQLLSGNLPGIEAHNQVMSYPRPSAEYAISNLQPKLSAVMCLLHLTPESILQLTLMERTKDKSAHSGQISFPGGKQEKTDADFIETAIRETEEELGINRTEIQVLGALTPLYIPPSNFVVYPYVGWLASAPNFVPEAAEVAQIHSISVAEFLRADNLVMGEIFIPKYNQNIAVKYFDLHGHKVWGATAMMLNEFRVLLQEANLI